MSTAAQGAPKNIVMPEFTAEDFSNLLYLTHKASITGEIAVTVGTLQFKLQNAIAALNQGATTPPPADESNETDGAVPAPAPATMPEFVAEKRAEAPATPRKKRK